MKKIIAILLSVLVLFSAVGIAAFAEDGVEADTYYTITFLDYDGKALGTRQIIRGGIVNAPANPERATENNTDYTFKGWSADGGETIYYANTLPVATADVTYTAIYSETAHKDYMTFWDLVGSIFKRINMIFEYFSKIFDFDFNRP